MTVQGTARWWRRGRDEAQARARAAAGSAASVFVAVDGLQRSTELQVDSLVALDPAAGARVGPDWQALRADTDAALAAYLKVPAEFDIETDLSERDARLAEAAFRHAEETLQRAATAMRDFTARHAAVFSHVEAAVTRLGAAGREADAALSAARAAIEAAERAGTPAFEAAEVLSAAERARAIVAEGPAVHGLRATVAAADGVLAEAARARSLAETVREQGEEVRRSLASVHTRADAVATRRERLPATLSALRREFVAAAYADVEGSPAEADRLLSAARERIAAAERESTRQHWPSARAEVAAAREALDAASHAVDAVTRRLAALEELKRDPREPVRRTRFAVREAQRLFVFLGQNVDRKYAPQLDSLVRRIGAAEEALEAPHPDYWRVDRDLARIRDETAAVVSAMRGVPRS
ncbi:hypothetical protein Val02_77550 [Virgisporangium aliadipatigenens]|uniref:Uncharacterized protein n=1 Tax=Virgisporangium aliadipatigenens TaxID=741659 RepID=A0A8J3YS58_9ACTN|nr:hypothetical protein [Virgisporangium aliadipatigenens]GIJ50869.1 hypothetical protein Val02_77550 [Virgisporangium aliadipatigenens]